jgi:hypothetical protein
MDTVNHTSSSKKAERNPSAHQPNSFTSGRNGIITPVIKHDLKIHRMPVLLQVYGRGGYISLLE